MVIGVDTYNLTLKFEWLMNEEKIK
jgi:hypothetical protein